MSLRMRSVLFLCLIAAWAALAAPVAQAAIMVNFTGNTYPVHANVDGHVNFMVLDRTQPTNPVSGDTWGTGVLNFDSTFLAGSFGGVIGPGLDTTALYLYLFQTVNDGNDATAIRENSVDVPMTAVTSWGHFNGMGFTEAGVLTAAGGLGPWLSGASAPAGDPSGVSVNGAKSGVAADGAAVAPSDVDLGPTSLSADFGGLELMSGKVSMLWGYTSNIEPGWSTTSMEDHGASAMGRAPSPIPEPASLLLWSVFGAAGVAFGWRRRRQAS